MYKQKVKEIVSKYECLYNVYNIGPVQKCIFEDFVEEIVTACAKISSDFNNSILPNVKISESAYTDYLLEKFGFKDV